MMCKAPCVRNIPKRKMLWPNPRPPCFKNGPRPRALPYTKVVNLLAQVEVEGSFPLFSKLFHKRLKATPSL